MESHIKLKNCELQTFAGFRVASIRYQYIGDAIQWEINPSADECLRNRLYTEGCLPLAAQVILIRNYLYLIFKNLTNGLIALSVARLIEDYIQIEFMPVVTKLSRESNELSLTLVEISTHMRPYTFTLQALYETLNDILKLKLVGGEILTLLNEKIRSNFSKSTNLILRKIEKSTLTDYYGLIFSWIRFGTIFEDCTHDFMVWDLERTKLFTANQILSNQNKENSSDIDLGDLDERFCAIEDLCPIQFTSVAKDIIICGKYVNIIEQIQAANSSTLQEQKYWKGKELADWLKLDYTDIINIVKKARIDESQNLVNLLRKRFKLDDVFDALRCFILLERSDWLISFIDIAKLPLNRPTKEISLKKLQKFFDNAIECSSLRGNEQRSMFEPTLASIDIFTLLRSIAESDKCTTLVSSSTGSAFSGIADNEKFFNLFNLRINVQSPLSFVFPPSTILNYSLIFRVLFSLHYALYILLIKHNCEDLMSDERSLIDNMLHFLNVYISHCSLHIIPNFWNDFMKKFAKSTSLEEILLHQNTFFKETIALCFLPDLEFINILSMMINIIMEYCNDSLVFENATVKWQDLSDDLRRILGKPNENNAYLQLQKRVFSRFF